MLIGPPGSAATPLAPTKTSAKWRLLAIVGPGMTLATILSLIGLTRSDVWLDEAYSLAATNQLATTLRETAGTMSTYYLLLNGWARIDDSLWWVRFLSVLAAVGSVALLGALVARQQGARAARWACLFAGASWMLVRYAQEARAYALLIALATAGWLALDHLVTRPDDRRWGPAYVVICALIPLTHGLGVLVVAANVLALAIARVDGAVWRRVVPGVVAAVAVPIALLGLGASKVGDWVPPLSGRQIAVVVRALSAERVFLALPLLAVTGLGVLLALKATAAARTPLDRFRAVMPLAWGPGVVAALIALSTVRPALHHRYAADAAPAIAILLALAAGRLDRLVSTRVVRRSGTAASSVGQRIVQVAPVASMGVLVLLLLGQVPLHRRERDPWRSVAATVASHHRAGDAVIFPTADVRLPFEASWIARGDRPVLQPISPTQPFGEVRRFSPTLGGRAMVDRALARDRIWVVDQGYDPDQDDAATFLADPRIAARFRVERRWLPGQRILLVLLDSR